MTTLGGTADRCVMASVLTSQDNVKIEEEVSCSKMRLVASGTMFKHELQSNSEQLVWSGHTSAPRW